MKRLIAIIITFLAFAVALMPADAQQRKKSTAKKTTTTQTSVRKRQSETKKAIQETSRKIETNTREIKRRLSRLNEIGADMSALDKSITATQAQIDTLDSRIKHINDTIEHLDMRLSSMSAKYASAIRRIATRNRSAVSDLAFIFSSESVSQAYRRSRSLDRFRIWRKRKADELTGLKQKLDTQRLRLEETTKQRRQSLEKLNVSLADLNEKKKENDRIVSSLKREEGRLKKILDQRRKEAAALENELQRLIAQEQERLRKEEEQRKKAELAKQPSDDKKGNIASSQGNSKPTAKPSTTSTTTARGKSTGGPTKTASAEINLSGSNFAANRGRIPFPVTGSYKIVKHFGRQKHPDLKYVEEDNAGIDIETSKKAQVRAVFDGYVSHIFRGDGFNNVVMIRHGNYITIYANLGSISVKKGDKVKAGQNIGTVYSDPDDDGRSVLHFEIRNERARENPEIWLS